MRSRLVTTVSLLALLAALTAPVPAFGASPDEVEFEGSGWGHGVGLSQYGAYANAVKGAGYEAILTHYYQGSSLASMSPNTTLWVSLEPHVTSLSLSVLDVGSDTGTDVQVISDVGNLTAVSGATISIAAAGHSACSVTVTNPDLPAQSILSPRCAVDFVWYNWATPGNSPTTKIQINGCSLSDWQGSPTTSRPCQYARGMLHLRCDWSEAGRCAETGRLDLSVELLMEDYVLGISEVPYSWPAEALKAQAVAARSYAESKRIQRGHPATGCDAWCHVKDSTADQAYVGWGHSNTGPWTAAVKATANQVLTHPDSKTGGLGVITTYYSSSSGGRTEYGHEKGFASSPVEWLSSVDDRAAVDGTVSNPNASWTKTLSTSSIASILGYDQLTLVEVTKRRPGSGSAAEVTFGGINNGVAQSTIKTGTWTRLNLGLKSEYFDVLFRLAGDEMFFYGDAGTFSYHFTHPTGVLSTPIVSGDGYTSGWKSITSVDLNGDGHDEIFFYRADGLFRFYDIRADGSIGSPILQGDGYTTGWDSITAVDLDGDGRDEMFFYREDGVFRFYDISPDGSLPKPMLEGDGYTKGWDAITAVDLDGDGQDEMFFYREDGVFRFYQVQSNGALPKPVLEGDGYTKGWDSITAVDLGGDGHDEMFFYRDDGKFRYYPVGNNGALAKPILAGENYPTGWDVITSINLDGQ